MKKIKYYQVYDDIKSHYEKELYWQKAMKDSLKRKLKTKAFKKVTDKKMAKDINAMYEENIERLKQLLDQVEELFKDDDNEDNKS